ncbi:MAG: glycerol-3-phosphate cytidylyltransferase [Bacteroidetes bacterium]|jgi:glycerol-3-phosphate cytidylyltransferase|nr:glycerol-3-phosphate cytidylyltransferase [Bacteroidota bacterium]
MKRGFICGVFDLLHYGHILGFRECRRYCEHLTVAVNKAENIDFKINPGKQAPVFPLEHRVELLKECRLVDEVLIYNSEKELEQLLETGKFDVRFLGEDYRDKPVTGKSLTSEIIYLDRSHGFSSSQFKNKLKG